MTHPTPSSVPAARWQPVDVGTVDGVEPAASVHLRRAQRAKHAYVIGATRSGKSKLLEWMIRHDVTTWPWARAGLVLFDPLGTLYNNLTEWLRRNPSLTGDRPIVPLDFGGADERGVVPSYNPLRWRRGADPAVVVDEMVRATAYAWGKADLFETPRLAKWLWAIYWALYETRRPVTDGWRLITDPRFRDRVVREVRNPRVRGVWERGMANPRSFDEYVESAESRLLSFGQSERAALALGNLRPSFDWGEALDANAIVLVNLATEGGGLTDTDSKTLASLLIGDLWNTLKRRGRRDVTRPFYGYFDEFHDFVSPVIAENLDQASGYGLHMVLSHQFPSQFATRGEAGRRVWDSINGNVRTVLAFHTQHGADVKTTAGWLYRQALDPSRVKRVLEGHQTVGHKIIRLRGEGVTRAEGGSEHADVTESESRVSGRTWQTSRQGSRTRQGAISERYGPPEPSPPAFLDELLSFVGTETEEEPNRGAETAGFVKGGIAGELKGEGCKGVWGRSDAGDATFEQVHDLTASQGFSFAEAEGSGEGGSEGYAAGTAVTHGTARSWSTAHSQSWSEALMPVLEKIVSQIVDYTLDEQLHMAIQILSGQGERHFVAKLDGVPNPVQLVVPFVKMPDDVLPRGHWQANVVGALPFLVPVAEARRLALERLEAEDEAADQEGDLPDLADFGSPPSPKGR